MDTTQKIIDWFNHNEDVFVECIEELDSYNGYLGEDRYYNMEELDELFSGESNIYILQRAYFGHDEENWHFDDHGEKVYGEFNPNRDYFRFNGYGNLVSANYKDYSAYIDHYAVEAMAENRSNIYTIEHENELSELFDELEAEYQKND